MSASTTAKHLRMVKSKRVTAIYSSHILFRLEQSGFLISFLLLVLDPADQSIYGTLGGISSTHEQNNCIYYAYSVMHSFIHMDGMTCRFMRELTS